MLYKSPKRKNKKFITKAATVLFVAEGLLFIGCYSVWYKLNTDRSFRKYMHNNFPSILEFYYSVGDRLGAPKDTKSIDLAHWEHEK